MVDPVDAPRLSAPEVWQRMQAGEPLRLVCAYLDPAKCDRYALSGSISFARFQQQQPELSKDTLLVFYCA